MKKLRFMIMVTFCVLIALFTNVMISHSNDFTSDHITVTNDVKMTNEKLHPVLILENHTNKDLWVTYNFYTNKNDTTSTVSGDILVKANESTMLELPQLHHLGDTHESRKIWFSWVEKSKLKPLQTQIETAIFSNPIHKELGLN